MTRSCSDSYGRILKAFLISPLNRKAFNGFFRMCHSVTVGYLRYLKARRFHLPLEPRTDRDPLPDLAIDLLGTLLHGDKEKPFPIIFDHFRQRGLTDFRSAEPQELFSRFTILLRGHVRQQLSRLSGDQNPQVRNLKRRFNEILQGPAYEKSGADQQYLFLKRHQQDLREARAPLPQEELLQIVERAYLSSGSRAEWCLSIFELVNEATEYRNLLKKHELLAAIVAVNAKYVDADGLQPVQLPGPVDAQNMRAIEAAITETIAWLDEQVLEGFVSKGGLDADRARRYRSAAEDYLTDLAHSGGTDSVPRYFREVMPENEHPRYLQEHKYLFEMTINKAQEDFRQRLKKKTTDSKYRDYFRSG